jgi:hypothetical protein
MLEVAVGDVLLRVLKVPLRLGYPIRAAIRHGPVPFQA